MGGQSRQGGKMKPEKGPKKAAKELDSDDERLIEKRRLDKKALQDMKAKVGGKGPLNTGSQGIKKSGKK